jgi:hypothetical protein
MRRQAFHQLSATRDRERGPSDSWTIEAGHKAGAKGGGGFFASDLRVICEWGRSGCGMSGCPSCLWCSGHSPSRGSKGICEWFATTCRVWNFAAPLRWAWT